jgi:hypothetical protein
MVVFQLVNHKQSIRLSKNDYSSYNDAEGSSIKLLIGYPQLPFAYVSPLYVAVAIVTHT